MNEELKQIFGNGINIYYPTADTTKQSGKTYYTRVNGVYTEFTGDVFAVGVTYYEKSVIPVAHLRYKGSSKTFVTWTITGETPSLCADDEDIYATVPVDVDVYSNGNYLSIVNAIKTLFKTNYWIWVDDSAEMYEEDTELYHKTISFVKERNL